MTRENFVWNDLSTFEIDTARRDYASLFGWSFDGNGTYDFASLGSAHCAAIFPMPQRFIDIKMPSFWMSYVHVDDLDRTVADARKHEGAIVELAPYQFDETARIALIRDPSGAGFTLYEGPGIERAAGRLGTVSRIYHHSQDVRVIEPFYRDLFGWSFREQSPAPWPVFDIVHADGTLVAKAEEVPTEIRGKFCYWMPCFVTASTADATEKIESLGGKVFFEFADGRLLVADRQGAHFLIKAVARQ
ncbi:MAG: VOC family protein [Filomicrobium sp.]